MVAAVNVLKEIYLLHIPLVANQANQLLELGTTHGVHMSYCFGHRDTFHSA